MLQTMSRVRETFVSVDSGSRDRLRISRCQSFQGVFRSTSVGCGHLMRIDIHHHERHGAREHVKKRQRFSMGRMDRWPEFRTLRSVPSGNYSESDLAVAVQNALNTRTAMQREPHSPRAYGCSFFNVDRRFYMITLFRNAPVFPYCRLASGGACVSKRVHPHLCRVLWPRDAVAGRLPIPLPPNMNTGVAYVQSGRLRRRAAVRGPHPTPTWNGMYFCNICQPGLEACPSVSRRPSVT